MYLEKLTIKNFRNFSEAQFKFTKGVNSIIGENGSGKTNLFEAMRMVLDDSLSNRERKLRSEDFNRELKDWKGHWISIQAFFSNIGTNEIERLFAFSTSKTTTPSKGSYSFIFRPKKEIRKKLYEHSSKADPLTCEAIVEKLTTDDYEFVFLCKSEIDLSIPDNYKKYVGDLVNHNYPNPEDKTYDEIWGNKHAIFDIHDQISFTYVKALRDAVRELKYSRNSPLKYLFEDLQNQVPKTELIKISGNVNELNKNITDLDGIKKFSDEIKETLQSSVGFSYAPIVQVKSQIPDDISQLLKSLALWVGDPNETHIGNLDELSLGGANLIYLSVKLLEYERKQKNSKITHFLLIEEPEAHIHTHIQKSLFDNLHNDSTQVFVSTHSTHLSAASKISGMNILAVKNKKCEVFWPSNNLAPVMTQKIERYLDAIRSNLLFAKGVILVEGDGEDIAIPAFLKNCLGINLDELGVSIVNIGSTGFENIAQLFSKDRIKRYCSIITDSDEAIIDVSKVDEKTTDKFLKNQFRSQKAGKERKERLNKNFKDNIWIKMMYSKHTFEIDLLAQSKGNRSYFSEIAENYYTDSIDEVKKELEADEVETYGRRVLKMSKKIGKGWFATELAEAVDIYFEIPDYIIDAVIFAGQDTIKENVISKMLRFQCDELLKNDDVNPGIKTLMKDFNSLTLDQKMDAYKKIYTDNLTRFYDSWIQTWLF
jgi:predicted ATP-dependent endonuclease of OLD family